MRVPRINHAITHLRPFLTDEQFDHLIEEITEEVEGQGGPPSIGIGFWSGLSRGCDLEEIGLCATGFEEHLVGRAAPDAVSNWGNDKCLPASPRTRLDAVFRSSF
jgi:hypothetical protein